MFHKGKTIILRQCKLVHIVCCIVGLDLIGAYHSSLDQCCHLLENDIKRKFSCRALLLSLVSHIFYTNNTTNFNSKYNSGEFKLSKIEMRTIHLWLIQSFVSWLKYPFQGCTNQTIPLLCMIEL